MTDIFLKILNMSISASFLVLAVLLLRILLKNAPKWIRVVLWGIVAVRLVCPYFVESEISLIPKKEYVTKSDIESENSSITDSPFENLSTEDLSKDDILIGVTSKDISYENSDAVSYDLSVDVESNSAEEISKEDVSKENSSPEYISGDSENSKSEINNNPPVSENQNNELLSIVAIIWASGMGLMVLYFVLSYVKLYNKVKTAVRLKDNVFQSENVYSPFILGFFNPKIYIPFNMPEKEMNFVLSHEKSHLRRMDHWWKPLGYLLLMVHWFNPFIWLSYILLCKDIELACDEKVVKNFSAEQKADYAKALLLCSAGKRNVLTCPVSFGETDIKGRVATVLKHKKPAVWIIAIGVVSCALLVAFFLTDPRDETESSADESNLSEDSNAVSEIEASENTSDESTAEEIPLEIKINYGGFDDSELDFTDSDDSEPYQITANQTIEKFKFFRVFYDENGKPYECGTLYGVELLTPDDAFSVRTHIRKEYSNRGISYIDEYGKECFFLVLYEDGLPVLIPFENESKKETEINVNVFHADSWKNRTIYFDGTVSGMIESVFPKGVSVNYFYIQNGVAHIDFNRGFSDYLSDAGNKYCIGLVVNSLLEYYGEYGVKRVLITVDDSKEIRFENELFLGKLGGDNDSSDDGKHYALLTLVDIYALKDYYYPPVVFDGTIDGLISKLSEACGWGNEIKVNHFEIKDNVAYIDFNEAFGDGVDVISPEDTRFYCVYDAIQSYYNVEDVKITMSASEKIPAIPEDKEVLGYYNDMMGNISLNFFAISEIEKWLNGTSDKKTENENFEIVGLYECEWVESARKFYLDNGIYNLLIDKKIQPILPNDYNSVGILCTKKGTALDYTVRLKEGSLDVRYYAYYDGSSDVSFGDAQYTANGGSFDTLIFDGKNDKTVSTKALAVMNDTTQKTDMNIKYGVWNVTISGGKNGFYPLWDLKNIGFSDLFAEEKYETSPYNFNISSIGNAYDEKTGFSVLVLQNEKELKEWVKGNLKKQINVGGKLVGVYSDESLEEARKLIKERGLLLPAIDGVTMEAVGNIIVLCDRFGKVRVIHKTNFDINRFSLSYDYIEGNANILDYIKATNEKYGCKIYNVYTDKTSKVSFWSLDGQREITYDSATMDYITGDVGKVINYFIHNDTLIILDGFDFWDKKEKFGFEFKKLS